MLYILTDTYQLDTYTDEGALFKHVTLCPCDCCDTACAECATDAECPHDSEGHTGGMCVAVPRADSPTDDLLRWRRIAHYPTHRGYVDCSCSVPGCGHVAPLLVEAQRHAKGERPAGARRERFLSNRPQLTHRQPPKQSGSASHHTHQH